MYGDKGMKLITGVTIVMILIMLLFAYRKFSTAIAMLLTILIELGAARGTIAVLATTTSFRCPRSP